MCKKNRKKVFTLDIIFYAYHINLYIVYVCVKDNTHTFNKDLLNAIFILKIKSIQMQLSRIKKKAVAYAHTHTCKCIVLFINSFKNCL